MKSLRDDLVRAYERAVYVAELQEGTVEFRIGVAPVGPAPDTPLAIITAWNPGHSRPTKDVNESANRQLEAALLKAGRNYYPAYGRSEDGTHKEPSFAVTGIDSAAVIALARHFRQAAVFFWDGKQSCLLWCDV